VQPPRRDHRSQSFWCCEPHDGLPVVAVDGVQQSVIALHGESSEAFAARGGRIPAPLQALNN